MNIIKLPLQSTEYRKRCEFHVYQVPIQMHGSKIKYPCIALVDIDTEVPILFTGYMKYAVGPEEGELSERTMYNRAVRISKFLTYLLWNTEYNNLYECTVTDIRNFLVDILYIGNKQSERSTWNKTKIDVFSFLVRYYQKKKDHYPFGYSESSLVNSTFAKGWTDNDIYSYFEGPRYNNLLVNAPRNKTKKNRILLYKHLDDLIEVATMYDPMLSLAIMLQAYAGLRASEVVNLSVGDVTKKYSYGVLSSIELNLMERAKFFVETDLRTNPGEIKKHRLQKVYDHFLKRVSKAYDNHLQYIHIKGGNTNSDAPLFVNEYNQPLTVQNYTHRLRELFKDRFVPRVEKQYESAVVDDVSIAYIEAYRKDYPGSHMLRHWFTMYLIVIAKLSRGEIKKWRGDSSEKSMEAYMHVYGEFVADYRESVYSLQNRILKAADTQNE